MGTPDDGITIRLSSLKEIDMSDNNSKGTEFEANDDFDLEAAKKQVQSAADLPAFLRLLNKEIIKSDPEYRDRILSDAFEGAAMWIEDFEQPDQPDWNFVARLLVGAIYYN